VIIGTMIVKQKSWKSCAGVAWHRSENIPYTLVDDACRPALTCTLA
jgi:hypothetical protein